MAQLNKAKARRPGAGKIKSSGLVQTQDGISLTATRQMHGKAGTLPGLVRVGAERSKSFLLLPRKVIPSPQTSVSQLKRQHLFHTCRPRCEEAQTEDIRVETQAGTLRAKLT